MNYNTVVAATVMAGQIRDSRDKERQRIIMLLLAKGQNEAAAIIMDDAK